MRSSASAFTPVKFSTAVFQQHEYDHNRTYCYLHDNGRCLIPGACEAQCTCIQRKRSKVAVSSNTEAQNATLTAMSNYSLLMHSAHTSGIHSDLPWLLSLLHMRTAIATAAVLLRCRHISTTTANAAAAAITPAAFAAATATTAIAAAAATTTAVSLRMCELLLSTLTQQAMCRLLLTLLLPKRSVLL
jgi:hypothetical protein